MGCHTWFYRKVDDSEMVQIKLQARAEVEELVGAQCECRDDSDIEVYNYVMSLLDSDSLEWFELGWGLEDNMGRIIDGIKYSGITSFHDVFRIPNYPDDVIYNIAQAQTIALANNVMLNKSQISKLQSFWHQYPGGIIIFG